ncbi:MAG: hypothetical protein GYA24_21010 [Candidatus Lokiarchaeota archaeon]|nr:hypothetical protein [Candidatus Lokiarchaeota archaeon]
MVAWIVFSVDKWFKQHEFSSYHAFIIPDTEEKPVNATKRGNCWISRGPDGFTLGNHHVFAAIGVPLVEAEHINEFYTNPRMDVPFVKEWDLSCMSLLAGPDKATAHLQCIPAIFKVQAFHASYLVDGMHAATWFKDAARQEARRVKNTRITATLHASQVITLSTINFAPVAPDEAFLARIVSITNTSPATLHDLALDVTFENRAASWSWQIDASKHQLAVTETRDRSTFVVKAFIPDADARVGTRSWEEKPSHLEVSGDDFRETSDECAGFIVMRLFLGDVAPWAEKIVHLVFAPVQPPASEAGELLDSLSTGTIQAALERTESACISTRAIARLHSSSIRLEDLYDSLVTMGACHVGNRGIHAGSVYYSHGRAWTRDNFWIQKAFHHVGFHDAAILNCKFFLDAWFHNGRRFANSYGLNSYSTSNPGNEVLVELPWYFVLMICEAMKWAPSIAGQLPREQVIDIVRAAVTESKYSPVYLFPLNSDETWIWACDVTETGFVLDNAMLALAALVSARCWLRALLDTPLLESVETLATRIHDSILEHFVIPLKNRFSIARDDDGTLDESAVVVPLSMPFIHDLLEAYPDLLEPAMNGLDICWQTCRVGVDGGGSIVRSHSATTSLTGNTPGHFLEATARINARTIGDDVLAGILNFVNGTGAVNEIHDIHDPSWGTEHQRLWDSMSVLEGIVQHLVGTRISPDAIRFTPYCPEQVESVSFDGLHVRGREFSFRMARKDGQLLCAVKMNGVEIARYNGLHEVSIDSHNDSVKILPVLDLTSSKFKTRSRGEYWGKIIPSIGTTGSRSCPVVIVHDETSKGHAVEIDRQLAFSLGYFVPVLPETNFHDLERQHDHFIWISKEIPIPARAAIMIDAMVDELKNRDYNIIALGPRTPFRTICWIPNKEHVYRDTNRFVQDIRLHVLPRRQKPMNMHPHGFLRLSDMIGAPITDAIKILVTCHPLESTGTGHVEGASPADLHVFVQGEFACTMPGGSGSWEGVLGPRIPQKAMPRREAYLLLNAVAPFAPFDLFAAGIATGANAVQITIQADAKVPLALSITLCLPQTWHPQNLRSPQWERVDDPVVYKRLPGGEQEMRVSIHPGRQVSRHAATRLPSTSRHLTFVFVQYPRLA